MGFSSIGLLLGSNKFVTQLSFWAIFTNIFVSNKPAANDPNGCGIPFPTAQTASVNARTSNFFLSLSLSLSNSNSDFSAEEPPKTIKMCRCREDDLPLSLEVRRALIAFIRQVEEQIAQLQEPRDGARAVLGGMEDDQGSEDDSDSEDDQDSEDDFSLNEEFWRLCDLTAQLCNQVRNGEELVSVAFAGRFLIRDLVQAQ
ncbi:hypothetical protein ACFX11_024176 [Malus domestica]